MSFIKSEDSRKWIYALVALGAAICGYLIFKLLGQLSVWFDLEAKVSNMIIVSQAIGMLFGFGTFIAIVSNEKSRNYLQEVYDELLKVVWPSSDTTLKITIGLVVALVIVAGIFVSVDYLFKLLLSFIY